MRVLNITTTAVLALGVLAGMVLASSTGAFAQNARSTAQSSSGSLAAVNISNNAARNTSVKTVGTAIAPGMASSGVSCKNSLSLGAGWMGGAGAIGIPMSDNVCEAIELAKIMGITDGKEAAREMLCDVPKVRKAFIRAGRPCSADRARASSSQYASTSRTVSYGVPVMRNRPTGKCLTNSRVSTSKYCK